MIIQIWSEIDKSSMRSAWLQEVNQITDKKTEQMHCSKTYRKRIRKKQTTLPKWILMGLWKVLRLTQCKRMILKSHFGTRNTVRRRQLFDVGDFHLGRVNCKLRKKKKIDALFWFVLPLPWFSCWLWSGLCWARCCLFRLGLLPGHRVSSVHGPRG